MWKGWMGATGAVLSNGSFISLLGICLSSHPHTPSIMPTDYPTLKVRKLAQILEGEVEFGDFTLLVGPQASGKSIFLQMLKLALDPHLIAHQFTIYGYDWGRHSTKFSELVFGEGMGSLWQSDTVFNLNGKAFSFSQITPESIQDPENLKGKLFYIIAQRVVTIQSGWPRAFESYDIGDPYVMKGFSETLRRQMDSEGGLVGDSNPQLFPKPGRLQDSIQQLIEKGIFLESKIELDSSNLKKRFLLSVAGNKLPFMAWSAGQKEFMPLLLSFYYLLPANGKKREKVEWVVIEEPEMGLHPQAIQSLMVVFLELIHRGYKLVISTHSSILLELVWTLRFIQSHGGTAKEVFELIGISSTPELEQAYTGLLRKKIFSTYYFDRQDDGVRIRDISSLDPGSEDPMVADWGGLTAFASRAGEVVSKLAADA